jgi:outer membrane lipase/esterase
VTLLSQATLAAPAYSSLVIFGDSLSDSGNNSNVPEIGANPLQVITGNSYIPSQTYSSAPFGVYSNGPVWATQFASMMGLSALPSLIPGGTNYAFGGARTSGGQVPDLLTQTGMYFGAAPTNVASTLFVVAGGGNNARDTFSSLVFENKFGVIGSAVGAAAATYANDVGAIVDRLQLAGATNIVVWNTPNIGLAPAIGAVPGTLSGLTPIQLGSLVSGANNGALETRLDGEAGVQIFDLYGLVAQAGANGFTNTTDACGALLNSALCPSIATALFWDGIHPTTAGHALIARQMFALAAPVPEPSTYAMLFVGLLVITRVVRRRAS